jgi:hypothetical protein
MRGELGLAFLISDFSLLYFSELAALAQGGPP